MNGAVKRKGSCAGYILGFIILLFLMVFASTVGSANISFVRAIKLLVLGIWPGNIFIKESTDFLIVMGIRLPRIVLASLIGTGLSLVGAVLQSLFRNPMAESGVLGISSGAALGASIAIAMGFINYFLGIGIIVVFAFGGALLTVTVVYRIALIRGRMPSITLLLAGIAISFICDAMTRLIMTFNRDHMSRIMMWTMGSLSAASWSKIVTVFPFILIGSVVIFMYAQDLNVISTGEEAAKTLGVNVDREKKILLAVCVFITAACVSVSGIIGFVGLLVPHIVRLITGPDHKILLPYSALGGAAFMLVCDTVARTAMPPVEIPVGIITALFGAPFFIFLLIKSKRNVVGLG